MIHAKSIANGGGLSAMVGSISLEDNEHLTILGACTASVIYAYVQTDSVDWEAFLIDDASLDL